ncbi:MAG: DUF302 domain-containing protein [Burkholderiales bacterium]|nr:DUF302 domain-containing protein [Burkholderiales bacterium]
MPSFRARLLSAVVGAATVTITAGAGADEIVRSAGRGTFGDVKDAVVAAIEGKGLVIDRVAHVGDMLDRTAPDVGAARRLYGKAEILEFCSARISRAMMEADPHQIVYCPYTIAVYTLAEGAGETGRVHVAYRRPAQGRGMADVARLLDEIVREALR